MPLSSVEKFFSVCLLMTFLFGAVRLFLFGCFFVVVVVVFCCCCCCCCCFLLLLLLLFFVVVVVVVVVSVPVLLSLLSASGFFASVWLIRRFILLFIIFLQGHSTVLSSS